MVCDWRTPIEKLQDEIKLLNTRLMEKQEMIYCPKCNNAYFDHINTHKIFCEKCRTEYELTETGKVYTLKELSDMNINKEE